MSKRKKNTTLLVIGGLALTGLMLGLRDAVVIAGEPSGDDNDDEAIRAGLRDVLNDYGRDYARKIEQLVRWESAHFNSEQWKEGNTAGMEATENVFPYGWGSLLQWATIANIPASQFSTYNMRENRTGIRKTFIRFPNVRDFINFVAWFIQNKRGGNVGYWYSLNDAAAADYVQSIGGVVPRIVNTL
jgi:hypothetical protein